MEKLHKKTPVDCWLLFEEYLSKDKNFSQTEENFA